MYENINFIDLNEYEINLVLSWRNNPKIKMWMHNKEDISLNDHLIFINSLKHDDTKDYFLVKKMDKYIGVVDLNKKFLGIYANPERKKVGDILLNQIIKFAFGIKKLESLKAEVYKKNISAIKLYTRNGFRIQKEDKEMLTMELSN
jgi:UDP-4-amino-4,6-dideoxy-N-acetyl-beta-L-altrosamine N-acetyltransferase